MVGDIYYWLYEAFISYNMRDIPIYSIFVI